MSLNRYVVFCSTALIVFPFFAAHAASGDWTGQPTFNEVDGPNGFSIGGGGEISQYGGKPNVEIPQGAALPIAATASGSGVSVLVSGPYLDASAPEGVSNLYDYMPLSDFATAASVDGLANQFSGFQTQINNFNSELALLDRNLRTASQHADQGIAMSFAMAGVADLQSDEHFAVSANWGTFRNQNGAALGVAIRVSRHVSINAGLAGPLGGGNIGGHAGIRLGW